MSLDPLRLEQCHKSQSRNPFCGTDWARVRDDAPFPWQRGLVGEIQWLSWVEFGGMEYPALYLRVPSIGKYVHAHEAFCEPVFDDAVIEAAQQPVTPYQQAALL